MPVTSKIPDYIELALERLPQQFIDKPNIGAFLKTWSDSMNELESVFYDELFVQHLYKNAEGDRLTKIARLLGVMRTAGESDKELRKRVVGAIMRIASNGTPNRIREILQSLTGVNNLRIFEHHPSALLMYGHTPDPNFELDRNEASYLKDAAPVGTGSCVFGYVFGEDSRRLFIPAELTYTIYNKIANTSPNSTEDPNFLWNIVTPDAGVGTDFIVVRPDLSLEQGGFIYDLDTVRQATLPDVGIRVRNFQVDYLQPDDIEDFDADTSSGIEGFSAEVEDFENDRGILLETVQVSIDDITKARDVAPTWTKATVTLNRVVSVEGITYVFVVDDDCAIYRTDSNPTETEILNALADDLIARENPNYNVARVGNSIEITQASPNQNIYVTGESKIDIAYS